MLCLNRSIRYTILALTKYHAAAPRQRQRGRRRWAAAAAAAAAAVAACDGRRGVGRLR